MSALSPLPIDPRLPEVVASLRETPNLVLSAEPAAGKTTRVPRALLDAGFADRGEILVLEPRRVAARMAARRVAFELGEEIGERIGFEVRFEQRASRRTRVRFVTEGVLTRKLVADPELSGVAVVVLDEFHERHLQGDLALALLRRLQRERRPELRLVVMSATLDAAPIASFLDCPVLEIAGRRFEVAIEHAERPDERPLPQRVAAAVRRLLREQIDGDVLVFLPGAAEIRGARAELEAFAAQADVELALLHGELPAREQDRALAPGSRRKVILSTNLAESSLTIEGVSAVVDSGLARVAGHSPWSGLPTLATLPISQASAVQRAGRAGRLREGRCVRLYTRHDFSGRPACETPEILRSELSETLLAVSAVGRPLEASDWLDAPPREAWQAARELCVMLGALDRDGRLSERGQRMLRRPLHPRLSRILVEAEERDAGPGGALLCALLSERDILSSARRPFEARARDLETGDSDLVDRLERYEEAEAAQFSASHMRNNDLEPAAVAAVRRVYERLLRGLDNRGPGDDESLRIALLAGFGDRVAQRRVRGSDQLVFARGGAATQSPQSVVREADLVVVLDAREQRGRGVVAHAISAVDAEWLLELFPDLVEDRIDLLFDDKQERIESVHALRYGGIVLDQSKSGEVPAERAAELLFEQARQRGLGAFTELEAVERFERRVAHASAHDARVAALPADARERALRAACEHAQSFSQVRKNDPLALLMALLPPAALAALQNAAPEHVVLPSGRRLRVHYEHDRPPWVASRLQDFFGMRDGPRLGAAPLVLHLLAPNQRAVQVTTDLAGFWQRHYPDLRKQLMRRYPRHAWPTDPLSGG